MSALDDHANRVAVGVADRSKEAALAANARFEVRSKLGSGGFGDVYEAFDRERHAVVALKYLRQFEPEQLYRLKREFRTLTDIGHPNLIRVYELFSSSDPPFFTMEMLKGRPFSECICEMAGVAGHTRELWYRRVRAYILQLCTGVAALHDAQLIHRDIKPSNVFLTNEGRAVLLDFGLVKPLDAHASMSLAILGTPHYSAPEQFDGDELTAAADWYSVGVLLFEALTGQRPFEGALLEVLSRKRHDDAPAPSAIVRGVPADLDALCSRLLSREPSTRPNGYEVLGLLRASMPAAAKAVPLSWPAARVFLGRDEQLAVLQSAFEETEKGAAVCVHVCGASGVGKTRVIRKFLEGVRESNPLCVVLSGRCYESEAAPHKGLDEPIDRLARFLSSLGPAQAQSLLPRYFQFLTRLFPVLQQFSAPHRGLAEIADPREQRHRAFGSLRECLRRISETRPLILWIDDLQWCDSDTVRLLNDVVQSADPFACLILLSYRDVGLDSNPALSGLDRVDREGAGGVTLRTLRMENLAPDDARDLAAGLLRQRSDENWDGVAATIARESAGNPFFVTELVHYALSVCGRGDVIDGSFGLRHIIQRRIGLLPEPALRLLELIAVAGQPLSADVCIEAAALRDHYHEIRSSLVREHLLRTHVSDSGEELDIYHDQIREAILGHLSHEATVVYHRLLAGFLEQCPARDHERLAVHWEAAGEKAKAIDYTIAAAEKANEALAFDRAARLYSRVIGAAVEGEIDATEMHVQLGSALSNAGRGKEAAEAFLFASERVDPMKRLDLRRRACEQYLRSGHLEEGLTLIRSLLRDAGVSYLRNRWAVIASLLWHRFRLRLHTSGLVPPTRRRYLSASAQRKLDIAWTGAVGISMVDVMRGAEFQARYTLLALKSGDPSREALGIAAELALGGMNGGRSRQKTDRLFTEAIQLANDTQNPHALGFALSMKGVASWMLGDWDDCYEKNEKAAAIFREKCSGVDWELTTAHTFALSALVFLGRWSDHARIFPDLVQQAEARGDRYGAVSLPLLAYTYVHKLAADRPAEARGILRQTVADWPHKEFQLQQCDALVGEAETFLYEGNARDACEMLQSRWPELRCANLLDLQFYRVLITGLKARTNLTLACCENGSAATRLMRAVRRDARVLAKQKTQWATGLGYLLQAGIATAEQRADVAMRHLHAAQTVFAATHMEHYLAVTRLRMFQIDPRHTVEHELGMRWMREQGIVAPSRIADMLAPGVWTIGDD